jgi:plastocyanin
MLLRSLALASAGVVLCALPATAATKTVAVQDDYFQPRVLRVYKGARIVWVNRGDDDHTVTTRQWSAVLNPGERYARVVRRDFRYRCVYHSDMTARVVCRNC